MKVLLDQGMNPRVRNALPGHETAHTFHLGWHLLEDVELLTLAEATGFHALITTDKRMKAEQNNATRKISLIVLSSNGTKSIRNAHARILAAVEQATTGSFAYLDLKVPHD